MYEFMRYANCCILLWFKFDTASWLVFRTGFVYISKICSLLVQLMEGIIHSQQDDLILVFCMKLAFVLVLLTWGSTTTISNAENHKNCTQSWSFHGRTVTFGYLSSRKCWILLIWALQEQIREFSLIGVNGSQWNLPLSAAFPARRGETSLWVWGSNKLKVICGCLLENV